LAVVDAGGQDDGARADGVVFVEPDRMGRAYAIDL